MNIQILPAVLEDGFNPVLLVLDYWDQPRSGIAMQEGKPVRFSCQFDEKKDDYSSTYLVRAVSESSFRLELEAYEIYFRHPPCPEIGRLLPDDHPIFPEAESRYNEIQQQLAIDRQLSSSDSTTAYPEFQRRQHETEFWAARRLWSVKW
ncbi:MAG: hypothetical protein AAGI37_20070 [Planctomycetota bacterium]